jgi:uncharacterized integral membrane protein
MQLFIVIATLLGLLSVAFALQNDVPVTVTLLVWRFDGSLAMVLLVAFALGALVLGLATTPSTLRRQWASRRQQKRIHELEAKQAQLSGEIGSLKNRIPDDPDDPETAEPTLPYVGLTQIFASRDKEP